MRAKDIGALSGLQFSTGVEINNDENYLSTDDRELAAYYASAAQAHGLGEDISDDDLESFRTGL